MPSIKELYSRLNDVKIDADTINVNTDGLESLLATTQADIALIKADLANGVLSDVRDGSGNAITSSARGSQRALSVQIVDGSGNQVTTFGSASVSVSNFPATQAVSGTISVSNFPATQAISGTVTANTGLTQPLTDTQLRASPVPIRPRNGAITVTAGSTSASTNTSAQALASNSSRQYLLIQNVSDTDMYFNFGATATADHLFIAKSGGGIVFESGFVPTDAVNAICSAASKKFYILSA
jgi:hypothetical protein